MGITRVWEEGLVEYVLELIMTRFERRTPIKNSKSNSKISVATIFFILRHPLIIRTDPRKIMIPPKVLSVTRKNSYGQLDQ